MLAWEQCWDRVVARTRMGRLSAPRWRLDPTVVALLLLLPLPCSPPLPKVRLARAWQQRNGEFAAAGSTDRVLSTMSHAEIHREPYPSCRSRAPPSPHRVGSFLSRAAERRRW